MSEIKTGKNQESLEQSRDIRAYLLNKWGRVPTSVWEVNWAIKYIDLSKSYGEQQKEQEMKVGKAFALSSTGNSGIKALGMSRFPQDIGQFLVKFLTPDKLDTEGYFGNYLPTVLDCFSGHNSRAELCFRCGRNYVGWDCSKAHCEMNRKVKAMLEEENKTAMIKRDAKIEFVEGDSRNIDYKELFDFCITSPPFYDSEWYGDEVEQLGRAKTYSDFLKSLRSVFEKVYWALKPNTYIAVETNDFRRNGEFHTYHADMIQILKWVGFEMHDIIICDYGSGFYEAFLSDIEANKIVSKNHSYFAIAKKLSKRLETREEVRERLVSEVKEVKESSKDEPKPIVIDNRQSTMF